MRRALSTLLPILVILAQAIPAHPADTSDILSLAFRQSAGSADAYRIHQHITGSRFIPGASTPVKVDVDAWSKVNVLCGKAGKNDIPLEVKIEPSVLKLGGTPADSLPAPRTLTLLIRRDGRITGVDEASISRTTFAFGTIESVLGLLILPDHPVTIGDTWMVGLGEESPYLPGRTLVYTLESLKVETGEKMGCINLEIRRTSPPDAPETAKQADREGSAGFVFSLTRGLLVSASGSIKSMRSETSGVLEHAFDIQRYDIAPSKAQ